MLMTYGMYVFGLSSAAYTELQRQTQWRHAAQGRIGKIPSRQSLGPGDDIITLTGTLLPPFTGGQQSLDDLREMANGGKAWPLIEGTGVNYGHYVIESLDETKGALLSNGAARRIGFTLKLARVDDAQAAEDEGIDDDILDLILGLFG